MRCKKCGYHNDRIIFEAVVPPISYMLNSIPETVEPILYNKWYCRECGQDHFEDGSIYTDPYANKQ